MDAAARSLPAPPWRKKYNLPTTPMPKETSELSSPALHGMSHGNHRSDSRESSLSRSSQSQTTPHLSTARLRDSLRESTGSRPRAGSVPLTGSRQTGLQPLSINNMGAAVISCRMLAEAAARCATAAARDVKHQVSADWQEVKETMERTHSIEMEDAQSEVRSLKDRIHYMGIEIEHERARRMESEQVGTRYKSEVQVLQQKVATLDQERVEQDVALQEARNVHDERERALVKNERERERVLVADRDHAIAEQRQKVSGFKQKLVEVQGTCEKLQEELHFWKQQSQEKSQADKRHLQDASVEKEKFQNELRRLKQEHAEQTRTLRAQLESGRSERAKLAADMSKFKSARGEREDAEAKLRQSIEKERTINRQISEELEDAKKHYHKEIAYWREQAKHPSAANVGDFREQLDALREDKKVLMDDLNLLRKKVKEKQTEIDSLRKAATERQADVDYLKKVNREKEKAIDNLRASRKEESKALRGRNEELHRRTPPKNRLDMQRVHVQGEIDLTDDIQEVDLTQDGKYGMSPANHNWVDL